VILMSKIKFTDQIASNPLMSYDGKDAAKPENKVEIIRYINGPRKPKSAFEKYWGCKSEEIVLLKEEEKQWCKI